MEELVREIEKKRAAEAEPFVLVQVDVWVQTCIEGCCQAVTEREPVVAQLSAVEAECNKNTDEDVSYDVNVLPWTRESLRSAMTEALHKGTDGVAEYSNLYGQLKKLVNAAG
jgi:rubrerythrin